MTEIINNYQYDYHNFNEIKYFNYKEQYSNQRILAEIKKDYEKLDEEIHNSRIRKQKGYIIKVILKKITIFGELKITRTKYQYYN